MAAIEYSPTLHCISLVLTKEESIRIKPLVLRAYNKEIGKRDEYQDRIESGYATKMEDTLMMKHDDAARELKAIGVSIEQLINY